MEEDIRARISTLYPGATIDIAGEGCNFEVFVVSDLFRGLGTLQRQKSILSLFKEDIQSGDIHALTVKARTPDELNSSSGLIQIQL